MAFPAEKTLQRMSRKFRKGLETILLPVGLGFANLLDNSKANAAVTLQTQLPQTNLTADGTTNYTLNIVANTTSVPTTQFRGIEWSSMGVPSYINIVSSSLPSTNDVFQGFTMNSLFNYVHGSPNFDSARLTNPSTIGPSNINNKNDAKYTFTVSNTATLPAAITSTTPSSFEFRQLSSNPTTSSFNLSNVSSMGKFGLSAPTMTDTAGTSYTISNGGLVNNNDVFTISKSNASQTWSASKTGNIGTMGATSGSVAANGSQAISLAWDNTTLGAKSGTITISDGNTSSPNLVFNVTGANVQKAALVSGPSLNLGEITLGQSVSGNKTAQRLSGNDTNRTRVHIGDGSMTLDSNGMYSSGVGGNIDQNNSTVLLNIAGTPNHTGTLTGSFSRAITTLENGGLGLPGETAYSNLNYTYSVKVNPIVERINDITGMPTDRTYKGSMDVIKRGDKLYTYGELTGLGGAQKGDIIVNVKNGSGGNDTFGTNRELVLYDVDNTSGLTNFVNDASLYGYTLYTQGAQDPEGFGRFTGMGYDFAVEFNGLNNDSTQHIDWDFSKYNMGVNKVLVVPEPNTLGLLALGATGFLGRRVRRERKK